jgi:hypothetical protein
MENPNTPTPEPTIRQLQDQVESLRSVVVSLLILCIVISGTFTLYLMRQAKYARAEAANLQAVVNEYNYTNFPVIKNFRELLLEYSKTHADFAPIARRYGFNLAPGSTSPAPAGAAAPGPAPSVAPKPKK